VVDPMLSLTGIAKSTTWEVNKDFIVINVDCKSNASSCSEQLKPDTEYDLTLRVYTSAGFRDFQPLRIKTEQKLSDKTLLIVILSVFLIFAIVTTGVALSFYKSGKFQNVRIDFSVLTRRIFDSSPANPPFATSFADINDKKCFEKKSLEQMHQEFRNIQIWASRLSDSLVSGEATRGFNRYGDILPFRENRFALISSEFENDYINASYVNVSFVSPSIDSVH
jgi:Protein-tyrosine phosphatase